MRTWRERGVFVAEVEGELIVGNRQELKQRLLDALAVGDRQFILDLSKTRYIDSSGLGVLVSIGKKVRDAEGRLVLTGMNEDLVTLVRADEDRSDMFSMCDTRERAVDNFVQAIAQPLGQAT
jgi:anti-sigma B factor antagonist